MGDVGNNGAYARLRAQATSMRRKAESVGNKLQAIAEGIAKSMEQGSLLSITRVLTPLYARLRAKLMVSKTLRTRTEQPSSQIKGQYRK